MNIFLLALIGTAISLFGTVFGSAFVFLSKKNFKQELFIGFASGVMIAASVWSLLIPAAEYAEEGGISGWIPSSVGFLAGVGFLLLMDKLISKRGADGKQSSKLVFAVTLHNFPEGMAVGLAFALSAVPESSVTLAAAFTLAIGIAIQNIPEGAIISLPLQDKGKFKAFLYGSASGVVEPIAGVLSALIVVITLSVIPWALAFAAGAMIYVVVDELLPGDGKGSKLKTLATAAGFVLMMVLDMAL